MEALTYETLTLEQAQKIVFEWLFSGKFKSYTLENCSYIDRPAGVIIFKMYTNTNSYRIVVKPPRTNYDGYIGCVGSSRRRRPGENWFRGNDLPDGPFSLKTCEQILRAIVNYELVDIKRPIRYLYGHSEVLDATLSATDPVDMPVGTKECEKTPI